MKNEIFKIDCEVAVADAIKAARKEVRQFCEIMGYPKSEVNRFIGDDPHGIADIMEGYRYFNMTAIHMVISEYERWLKIYGDNKGIRKAVEQWYYYCQEWYEQHSYEEPRWVSVKERLPKFHTPVFAKAKDGKPFYAVMSERRGWYDIRGRRESPVEVNEWKPIITPEQEAERSKGCPNLRSWLAGCPVDGLRDATLEWQTQRERDLQAAHQRVEECKRALEDAIKEEVKLNKF